LILTAVLEFVRKDLHPTIEFIQMRLEVCSELVRSIDDVASLKAKEKHSLKKVLYKTDKLKKR
jgi:hypothetical protein